MIFSERLRLPARVRRAEGSGQKYASGPGSRGGAGTARPPRALSPEAAQGCLGCPRKPSGVCSVDLRGWSSRGELVRRAGAGGRRAGGRGGDGPRPERQLRRSKSNGGQGFQPLTTVGVEERWRPSPGPAPRRPAPRLGRSAPVSLDRHRGHHLRAEGGRRGCHAAPATGRSGIVREAAKE